MSEMKLRDCGVFGPKPPCSRCMRALEILKKAVRESQLELHKYGVVVHVKR